MAPESGAVDVSPGLPVSVTVADGTIETLTLTNPDGKVVIGTLAPDKTSWTVGEHLGYGKTYTWAGTAKGADGKEKPITGQFTTVTPQNIVDSRINTGDGKTYGIAMPIAITFDSDVVDRAAAQAALTVETSVPVEGAWSWLNSRSVHYRPKTYWPANITVNVTAKLYGVHYGEGKYGDDDLTSSFTIGRSQIVKADSHSHRMIVIRDGVEVANYPASYGLESDPRRITRAGIHVVMSKHESYTMSSETYGYEGVTVPYAVRISNNGEFVHGYANSISAQGNRNVSHGCLNLSPANAKLYFETALVGDPVEVVSSVPLTARDGDYYDWVVPWEEWLANSAG